MGFRSGVNPGIVKSKEASFDKTDRKGCTNAIMYVCMYVCCTEGMRALPMLVKTGGPEKLI